MEITLSKTELILLNNVLNEIANGVDIDDEEFETRLGSSREEVRKLLTKVSSLIDSSNV